MSLLLIFNKALTFNATKKELEEILDTEFVLMEDNCGFREKYDIIYRTKERIPPKHKEINVIDLYQLYYDDLANLGYDYIGMDWSSKYFYVGYKVI